MWKVYRFMTSEGEEGVIRAAYPKDAYGFVASLDEVCRESVYLLHDRSPRSAAEQERQIRMLNTELNLIAALEINQNIVGGMGIFVGGASMKSRSFCNLGIHLVKDARGKGLGGKMLSYGIEWARNKKYHKICLSVFGDNDRAIRLYKHYGFVEEGRRLEQYQLGDHYVDELLMAYFL